MIELDFPDTAADALGGRRRERRLKWSFASCALGEPRVRDEGTRTSAPCAARLCGVPKTQFAARNMVRCMLPEPRAGARTSKQAQTALYPTPNGRPFVRKYRAEMAAPGEQARD